MDGVLMAIAAVLAGAKLFAFVLASELAEERDIALALAKAREEARADEAEADSAEEA